VRFPVFCGALSLAAIQAEAARFNKHLVRRRLQLLVTKNLAAQIYQQLRHELMAGRYEPGQKLKLRDLAERLGVSVTPVREALARLVSDQALVQVDHLPRYAEVRELRLDLEGKAAERAAGSATPADIAELRLIHQRLLDARTTGSHAFILLENQNFHLALCRFAYMPVLLHLVETLWLQCGPSACGSNPCRRTCSAGISDASGSHPPCRARRRPSTIARWP
jgi:DNA-binding GntR family transcriptional regulator